MTAGVVALPPQMIPLSDKDDDWKHACMDILEQIGKSQHYGNIKLLENYEMIKGRFVFKHYFEDEGYSDMVNQLTREFEIPSYLRHYDIISQVINTMSGEWQARPDNFRVKSFGERYDNDYLRAKTDLILNYIQSNINNEINKKLLDKGLDPNKKDFNSPEEQQQYVQLVDQQKQLLTPPEIEIYMSTKWMQIAEIWGQHQLEYDRERFKFEEKEKKEFEDMLTADRCFRHFYLTGNTYKQETWNPVNTFFHKSPEVEYIEEGDYVGRVYYLTVADVIDRYGWLMTQDEIEGLRNDIDFKKWQNKDAYGIVSGSIIPYEGFQQHKVMIEALGSDPRTSMGVPTIGKEFFSALHDQTYYIDTRGLLQVTEGYWRSQKKIGKVTYINEDGILTKTLVDENFIVPKNFKEVDSTIYETDEPNTVMWTWVNEVWKGTKINARNYQQLNKDLYIDIKPLEFQFKGELNPYSAKLPVCGQVFSVRNSSSMSLVDLMKPYQIGYNVAMNQLYQIMEREIGRFIVMDVNMFPGLKDWGGEKAWDKFMLVAKNLGLAPIDTSPQNTNQAAGAVGGQFPREVDLDESSRMASRIKIAEFFETMALKQVGFNEYRLGNFASTSTAGGVENGKEASYSQTESYFTNFSNYLRRCYTMDLDIAQYVQSRKDDITVSYIKSDLSRAFTKIAGMDLLGVDMGIFVSNSQEMMRQLNMLRQLAMTNNQSGATIMDLAAIVTMNSPSEIKLQLGQSFKEQQARIERQQQLAEAQLQQEAQLAQMKEEREDMRLSQELESKERIAYIQADGKASGGGGKPQAQDNSGQPLLSDVMAYDKLQAQKDKDGQSINLQREKQLMDKDKLIADKQHDIDMLALERKKIEAGLIIENKKLEIAKVMKGKPTTSKSPKK